MVRSQLPMLKAYLSATFKLWKVEADKAQESHFCAVPDSLRRRAFTTGERSHGSPLIRDIGADVGRNSRCHRRSGQCAARCRAPRQSRVGRR